MKKPPQKNVVAAVVVALATVALVEGTALAATHNAEQIGSGVSSSGDSLHTFSPGRSSHLSRATGVQANVNELTGPETLMGGQVSLIAPTPNSVAAISQNAAVNVVVAEGSYPSLGTPTDNPAPTSVQLALLTSDPNPSTLELGNRLVWVVTYSNITISPIGGVDPRTGNAQASEVHSVQGTFVAIVDATTGQVLHNYAGGPG